MSSFDTKSLLAFWVRWERTASMLSMVVGFAFDTIVAKRPDSVPDNLLLLAYLLIAAGCIVLLERRVLRPKKVDGIVAPETEPLVLLLVLQFCFGGLASNLLVLYGHSGTLSGTALFLGILAGMLIGNEYLRSRYNQLRFNLAVYYTLLLTYLVIAVPTFVYHHIGTAAFILSGVLSAAWMAAFIFILSGSARLFRGKFGSRRIIESSLIVAGIFVIFNGLYFLHFIPPVPLSLKASGIYHSITHDASGYEATLEAPPWWEFWATTSGTYHIALGAPAYCFSAIYAPQGLTTPIVHQWEWQSPATGVWMSEARVTFPITGGRAGGYYGYSIKSLDEMGQWRCDVETSSGALIGQVSFTAVSGSASTTALKL